MSTFGMIGMRDEIIFQHALRTPIFDHLGQHELGNWAVCVHDLFWQIEAL